MQSTLDVAIMPLDTRLDAIRYSAVQADKLGYLGYSLSETWSHSSLILIADLANRTENIHLTTGIISLWSRSPGTIAMSALSLQAISNGRFRLGVGASTPQLTEGLHDIAYTKPYTKLRTALQQIRALLDGDRVDLTANPSARALKINLDPSPETQLHLAAVSEKSIKMVGELCDGWIPYLYPRNKLLDAMALIEEGRAQSANPDRPFTITPAIPTVVAPDEATARKGAAWFMAFYLINMGTIYRNALIRMGYEREVEMVIEANAGQRAALVPPEAEVLLDQFTVYGTPEQARQRLARWYVHDNVKPSLLLAPHQEFEQLDYTLNAFVGDD